MSELNMNMRKNHKLQESRLNLAQERLSRLPTRSHGFVLTCCSLIAALFLTLCLPFTFASAQDDSADQAQQPAAQPIDQQAALQKLLERQAVVKKLLPNFMSTTVCLTADGGSGSGVVVNKSGLILTAAHVVGESETMKVKFADGRELTGKVLGIYKPADAAMMQIVEEGEYEFATIAPQGTLELGQTVLATGHPSGYDKQRGIPLRMGHISSFKPNFFACDAVLIGGDSGGPSFNLAGQVIGIHSNVATDKMSVNNDVHIDAFWENWDSMLAGEVRGTKLFEAEKAEDSKELVFGVKLVYSLLGEPIRVKSVAENTPAAWAGFQQGDVILTVNGDQPKSSLDLMAELLGDKLGRELKLGIRRGDKELLLDAKLLLTYELKAERKRREGKAAGEKKGGSKKKSSELDSESTSNTSSENISLPIHHAAERFLCAVAPLGNQQSQQQLQTDQATAAQKPGKQQPADQEPVDQTDLQKLLEQSRKNSGRLKIDRERLKKYRNELSRRIDRLGVTGGRARDAWSSDFQQAFGVTGATLSQSIFPVMTGGRHVASALMVDPRGYLVSKASECSGCKVTIRFNEDSEIEATIVQIENDLDIVVLKVNLDTADTPPHVDLVQHAADQDTAPGKGIICGAVNHQSDKLAGFGVVSVAARALNGNTSAFLGVGPEDVENTAGVLVKTVQPKGPADRAGLKVGDIIESVDDQVINNSKALMAVIHSRLPNENAKFNIRRGDRWLTLPLQLGDKSKVAPMPGAKEQAVDGSSTSMSRRRWNFTQGIQHDCMIHPKDCGGVLVDLEGHVIGLNIARAGRIKSYAIPVKLASDFIAAAITKDLSQGGENE